MGIIPAQYYQIIYLIIVGVLTIVCGLSYSSKRTIDITKRNNNLDFVVFFYFLLVFFIGLRPISGQYFADMSSYAAYYYAAQSGSPLNNMEADWLFQAFMGACARSVDVTVFFLLCEVIYLVPIYIASRRIAWNNTTLVLLFFLGAFSTFSYGTNGIRNGLACSLVILAATYLNSNTRDKIICALLCFLAIGFHKSTFLPVSAMVFSYFYKKPKTMFYFWVSSIFISLAAGNSIADFFSALGFDDRMEQYIHLEGDVLDQFSKVGFRWDFLLYSTMPIIMGWYAVFKRKIIDLNYLILLGTYIYSNAFWIMVIRAPYSNRFAYLSWFIYPIVLCYPMLKFDLWRNQGGKVALILLGQFVFTLFMFLR